LGNAETFPVIHIAVIAKHGTQKNEYQDKGYVLGLFGDKERGARSLLCFSAREESGMTHGELSLVLRAFC